MISQDEVYKKKIEENVRFIMKVVKYAVLFILILFFLFGSFGKIDAGERGIKTRFGKVITTLDPGLYFKIPFIEKVTKINIQTYSLADSLASASFDLQDVNIAVVVNYHLDTSGASILDVYTQYGSAESYYSKVINPLITSTVKAAVSQYTAAEQIQKRAELTNKVLAALQESFKDKNVVLEKVDITNITFSSAFTKAIEEKVTAVQNAETQKNKLEQIRYESQQKILAAEAEAKSIQLKSQAASNEKYVSLKRLEVQEKAIEKWNGAGCTSYCGLESSTGLLINSR